MKSVCQQNLSDKRVLYIYQDEGADPFSASLLTPLMHPSYRIHCLTAEAVAEGEWTKDAALFLMPGGADLPYVKKLKGKGNAAIRGYVAQGGSYLGICAGAYYGSAFVEFDKNGPLEVLGDRELAFFRGKAVGPVLAPYAYGQKSGAQAATVMLRIPPYSTTVYYNGGGYFEGAETCKEVTVIGSYYPSCLPAIVHVHHGKGQAILSGVHIECAPCFLTENDPHVQHMLPCLIAGNSSRLLLLKAVLQKLGVSQEGGRVKDRAESLPS